jgi:hypothetical protein
MTVTQFSNELASFINKADLPFDAKVFVVRSIHNEVECKYNEYLNAVKMAQEQAKAQPESEEKQT